jgi:ubiquinone/menaquinone biosynthesis C-methylase UbiE
MELSVAKTLIQGGIENLPARQFWADLGAGEGLFTKALADCLPADSKIIAIDRDAGSLKTISVNRTDVELQTVEADLNKLPENLPPFDGIVIGNALHYIKDQLSFLRNLKTGCLKKSGVLILIEYDLEKSNPWVPYPINKTKLGSLCKESGFELRFSNSVKSKLNSSEIYSAFLKPEAEFRLKD